MREDFIRGGGLLLTLAFSTLIVWLYTQQPKTLSQITGGLASTVGAYRIDEQSFATALELFRKDQFAAARAAFNRADPAERDARTQFYIAYSYYREGWHRLYRDDALFAEGVKAVNKARALAPDGNLVVDDPNLAMRSADELRAELEAGLKRDASDFNPLRVFETRK